MKPWERKIKRRMPFDRIPAYLRQLADALERQTDRLPAELSGLPASIAKLDVQGKARDSSWEMKIKIKGESAVESEHARGPANRERKAAPAANSDVDYPSLKRRIKSSFRSIGVSLAAQRFPGPDIIAAFLDDSERMLAFTGENYGEPCYPAYRDACCRLAEAFETNNRAAFQAAYTDIGRLKKDCHAEFK